MKTERFQFRVEAVVSFTHKEIDHLMKLSLSHYDGYCQSMGQPGGFLYGLHNERNFCTNQYDPIERTLTFRQLDTLCKITESEVYHSSHFNMWTQFRKLIHEMKKQSEKVNS